MSTPDLTLRRIVAIQLATQLVTGFIVSKGASVEQAHAKLLKWMEELRPIVDDICTEVEHPGYEG